MRKLLVLLIGLLLLSFSAGAVAEQTLSVVGTGLVQVEPDTALLRLGVEVLKDTAQLAQSANAEIMQKIISALLKQGIPKEKIQTTGFNIWQEVKYEPNKPPAVVGYRCGNQVLITIEDLNKISRIIDAGVAAGANQVQGIQFSRKDDTPFKKQALEKAVAEAKEKASSIALAAGLKLKGIKSIIESGAVSPLVSDAVRPMAMAATKTPISPGLLEIRGNVTIIYRVE